MDTASVRKEVRKMTNNGSAFPVFDSARVGMDYGCTDEGMSLRDWFAGQALVGLLSSCDDQSRGTIESFVEYTYEIADAMLKLREANHDRT
jgi:hypothetical protein